MTARKGWLTPNAPLPSDTVCRRILIPNDLQIIAAVNGSLLELTKNYNWEQFGSASPEEIAAAMLSMYLDYVSEPCESGGGGCRRIYRIGQGGQIERSDDAGETWESAADEIPPTPARTEPTEEERLCNAAANAVNVLHQTYEEMIDAWQLDSSVDFGIGAFATILGLLVGSWLGVVSAVAIPFVWELFGSVYATIGTFLQDAWDSDFTDDLTCLFLEAASDTGGVVTFNWSAISQGLADRVTETAAPEDALLWAQLNYMVLFIGVEGLNAAGATNSVVGNCAECYASTWCYEWDFTQSSGEWFSRNATNWGATWYPGEGWGKLGSVLSLGMVVQMPEARQITSVRIEWTGGMSAEGIRPTSDDTPAGLTLPYAFFDGTLSYTGASPGNWNIDMIENPSDPMYVIVTNSGVLSSTRITKIRLTGNGSNPFGQDNCV